MNDLIPANPIPLMPVHHQNILDDHIERLILLPDRFKIRSNLISLIDCEILFDTLGNNHYNDIMVIREEIMNRHMNANGLYIQNTIMNIVRNSTARQRIHIFNRITMLFRPNAGL
jgi:hypothetical protein